MTKCPYPRQNVLCTYKSLEKALFLLLVLLWDKYGNGGRDVVNESKNSRVITRVRGDGIFMKKRVYVETKLTEEEKKLCKAIAKERTYQAEQGKKIEDIADIVRAIGRSEYIVLEDGASVTVNDMLVASAYGNALKNPETSFKDLLDAQKVANNDTSDGTNIQIQFVTNGQDLGD